MDGVVGWILVRKNNKGFRCMTLDVQWALSFLDKNTYFVELFLQTHSSHG